MDYEAQLKLQAYLDGELPEGEARAMASRLAQDPEATALMGELKRTRQALIGFEAAVKMPETREFFWSRIEREIQRQDGASEEKTLPLPFWLRLRRLLVPLTGAAALAVAVWVGLRTTPDVAAEMQTAMTDPDSITYQDYDTGATVVWFSYPAENEVAKN